MVLPWHYALIQPATNRRPTLKKLTKDHLATKSQIEQDLEAQEAALVQAINELMHVPKHDLRERSSLPGAIQSMPFRNGNAVDAKEESAEIPPQICHSRISSIKASAWSASRHFEAK